MTPTAQCRSPSVEDGSPFTHAQDRVSGGAYASLPLRGPDNGGGGLRYVWRFCGCLARFSGRNLRRGLATTAVLSDIPGRHLLRFSDRFWSRLERLRGRPKRIAVHQNGCLDDAFSRWLEYFADDRQQGWCHQDGAGPYDQACAADPFQTNAFHEFFDERHFILCQGGVYRPSVREVFTDRSMHGSNGGYANG